jgi:hypothetical protein
MSWMFEVYYKAPVDTQLEARIRAAILPWEGAVTCHETPGPGEPRQVVVVTCESPTEEQADQAAEALRHAGYHVEGPYDYGD